MDPSDGEKTAFLSQIGISTIPSCHFGLKNACATYQRAMTAIFHDLLHDSIEDYVANIIVKSKEVSQHADDLRRVFLRCRL